ncbi:MAG TPA: hypothetical protein VED46_07760 [Alphaproteobacteria bacterium]|nr:hypothetical protein [Alphaproteobacteria bacterium]
MRRLSRAVPIFALLGPALSGCVGDNQDRAVTTSLGKSGVDLVSYTGTTRGAYVWPDGNAKRVCAEPPPDLGLTTAREISANLKAAAANLGAIASPSIDAGGAAKLSSAAIELAGRSQLVLLTREFLYRECELAANFAPGTPEYEALSKQYLEILKVVATLAEADRDRAAADLLEAQIAAAALEHDQESKIEMILGGVINPDGGVDRDRLSKLLAKAEIDPSIKDALLAETTREGLSRLLDDLSDQTIDAILAARAG